MKTLLEEHNHILQSISTVLKDHLSKRKAGRPPTISNLHILALFMLSYKTPTPVLILVKTLMEPSVQSYHIFRKSRIKRVFKLMREYHTKKIQALIALKLAMGKKLELVIDGSILEIAKLSRPRTQRIKRFSGKVFWAKGKRKVYSEHYKEYAAFEEVFYGMLVMVVCDEKGVVYDLLRVITRLGL